MVGAVGQAVGGMIAKTVIQTVLSDSKPKEEKGGADGLIDAIDSITLGDKPPQELKERGGGSDNDAPVADVLKRPLVPELTETGTSEPPTGGGGAGSSLALGRGGASHQRLRSKFGAQSTVLSSVGSGGSLGAG